MATPTQRPAASGASLPLGALAALKANSALDYSAMFF